MKFLRKAIVIRPISVFLSGLIFVSSCTTTRYVDDHSRPRYEEKSVPIYEEVDKTTYNKTPSPVFRDQNQREMRKPMNLGMIDFWGYSGTSFNYHPSIRNQFYQKLRTSAGVYDKYVLLSSETIQQMYNISELHPGNRRLMSDLSKDGIPFTVSAQVLDTRNLRFELNIHRTSDGIATFSREFKDTGASKAIDDAVWFLMREEVPNYTKEQKILRYDTKRELVGYEKNKVTEMTDEANTLLGVLITGLVIWLVVALSE